ncbi:MAG TPA: muconolactone Delta-isomerase family protein [Solirubrobacteraceae bacterium]|jgi:muconolactone delta-isomerase|nr:muconolactone Delta-isomerase family protein [Solirubrobacteraceae bacterium]
MKFLVIVTPRPVPMPPGVIADLLAAQKEWLTEHIANGTLESVYGVVGGGGVGIANIESHERMHELLVSSPGYAIADYEVRAIGDFASNIDAGVASLRQAASMMPGPPG